MNLQPILRKYYPQGSQGNECVGWLHRIYDFPPLGVDPKGNDVNLKFTFVQNNGNCSTAANIAETFKGYRIGDCVFTTEGAYKNWLGQWKGAGHMATITGFDKDSLVLAESNYDLDHKVKYGRKLAMNSGQIIGIGRFPFKIDLKLFPISFSYDVFINNQKWNNKVFADTENLIKQYSNGRLNCTIYPLRTNFKNWWYEYAEQNFKVISKDYIQEQVMPLAFTNANKGGNAVALIIKQAEWQGEVLGGGTEIAYYHYATNPAEIQIASDEKDLSFWYPDMPLAEHALVHELSHFLHYVSGQTDTTHNFDNSIKRQLNLVYQDLDFNRLALNL